MLRGHGAHEHRAHESFFWSSRAREGTARAGPLASIPSMPPPVTLTGDQLDAVVLGIHRKGIGDLAGILAAFLLAQFAGGPRPASSWPVVRAIGNRDPDRHCAQGPAPKACAGIGRSPVSDSILNAPRTAPRPPGAATSMLGHGMRARAPRPSLLPRSSPGPVAKIAVLVLVLLRPGDPSHRRGRTCRPDGVVELNGYRITVDEPRPRYAGRAR